MWCAQVKCAHLIYKAKIIQAERDHFNNYRVSLQYHYNYSFVILNFCNEALPTVNVCVT